MKKVLLMTTLAFSFTTFSLPAFACDCEKNKGKAMSKKEHAACAKCKLEGKKTCSCDHKKMSEKTTEKSTEKKTDEKESADKDDGKEVKAEAENHESH